MEFWKLFEDMLRVRHCFGPYARIVSIEIPASEEPRHIDSCMSFFGRYARFYVEIQPKRYVETDEIMARYKKKVTTRELII